MNSRQKKLEVLALIPARSGSKSIANKNIRLISEKPLIAHSIEHGLSSDLIDRVVVSTDSKVYAEIASKYGAEVPFLRPVEISQDDSTDLEVFTHAIHWLREKEGYMPDICVHLRPTYPIRNVQDITNAIQMVIDNPDIDSVRSVVSVNETPFKMWFRDKDGLLSPAVKTEIRDVCNLPRQDLPQAYLQNACIDVVKTRVIIEQESMTGSKIVGYVMEDNFDIDTEQQWHTAERYFNLKDIETKKSNDISKSRDDSLIFCFDIDGVIANLITGNQYDLTTPINENIHLVNMLYQQGHQIILFTARGSATGIDWCDVTRAQMSEWGVRYHQLLFGKPAADYYIDDKFISIEDLKRVTR
jgi:CMP-N-acetylneuraminic acid synthetase